MDSVYERHEGKGTVCRLASLCSAVASLSQGAAGDGKGVKKRCSSLFSDLRGLVDDCRLDYFRLGKVLDSSQAYLFYLEDPWDHDTINSHAVGQWFYKTNPFLKELYY